MSGPWPVAIGLAGFGARLVLAAVFAIAGIAKLRDLQGTSTMLLGFGAPKGYALAAARVLPIAELLVAAALLTNAGALPAAIAALLLLLFFSLAVAVNLALGRKPECRCFGQINPAPIGWATLARNLCLIGASAVAATVTPAHQMKALSLAAAHTNWFALAGAAVVIYAISQTFLMLQILRQQGRMLLRLDALDGMPVPHLDGHGTDAIPGLPLGHEAPAFELPTTGETRVSLADLRAAGRRIALFFTDPKCGPCAALIPEIAAWTREFADLLTIAIVSQGTIDENRRIFSRHGIENVLLQSERSVSEAFGTYGTPSAVIIEADGTIASGIASGADAVRELIVGASATVEAASMQGRPAPPFSARTADGALISSSTLARKHAALLFWNPDCGFCQAAAKDILEWNRASAATLVVVSNREDKALSTGGLRAPLVIDEAGRIAQAFGAGGTPMAVRIAPDGTIASGMAAGKDAVMRLLRELDEDEAPTLAPA